MTAESLIQEIADRGWLPDAVLQRVRSKLLGRSIDAETIARFLTEKGHLTQAQVDELLGAPADESDEPPMVKPLGGEEPLREVSSFSGETAKAPPFADPNEDQQTEESRFGDDGSETKKKPAKKTGPSKAERAEQRKKERERRKKQTTEWESPLMLIGSAGLILLLLCGFGVYYLLIRGSGDDLLKNADTLFSDGSYTQAISQYEKFLEEYPTHEGSGFARVNLGLSRIRQALEVGGNFEQALERSEQEIPEMLKTDNFDEAQRDLSALLPKIATGLVGKADAAEELPAINKYVSLTNQAIELNVNSKYVPSQLRNKPEIQQVEEVLRRIGRRQAALQALKDTLDSMRAATASGDIRPAYEAHAALVKSHPELAGRDELTEAIAAAVTAEQGGIRFIAEPIDAKTTEPRSAIQAVVATADQRREGRSPASGAVVFQFQGVAYGLDAGSGRLLWRRSLGEGLTGAGPMIAGDRCLLVDARRQELVAVDTATGSLRWRTPIGEETLQPVRLGDRVLTPTKNGRVHVVELSTGRRSGYLEFAQPLASAPVVSSEGNRVYLVGEHSSVYTLSADDLSCLGVFYLGHAKGSVVASPAPVLGKLLVSVNGGLATSRLHVLTVDGDGVVNDEIDVIGLDGLSPLAPIIFGRRLATVTDSGQITVYETSPQDPTVGLTEVAARRSGKRRPIPHHALLVGQHFWVGGHGLAKYSIQPTGNRLPKLEVRDKFATDVFVAPLVERDGVVLHARRRRGEPGMTVGATDAETGSVYWETDVAVPAAGAPSASIDGRAVLHASATGRVYTAPINGTASIATPEDGPALPESLLLTCARPGGRGGSLVTATGRRGALRIGPAGSTDWAPLPDSIACDPTPFRNGWVVPLEVGQALYLDRDPAVGPSIPFQPELKTGIATDWLPAGRGIVRGEPTVVLSTGVDLYALQLFDDATPRLEAISEVTLDRPLTTRVAIAAEQAIAGRADGSLAVFDAESLDPLAETSPAAPIAWGPHAVGDRVLVARFDGRLACFDLTTAAGEALEPSWSVKLPTRGVVGEPLPLEDAVLLATRSGDLHRLSLADGEIRSSRIGESLASSATSVAGRLVLAAADGALVFVSL